MSYCRIENKGSYDEGKFYYKDKEYKIFHREDGPAIEWINGDKAWYINGNLHRDEGPAVEFVQGDMSWFKNGKLHREDGPAYISRNPDNNLIMRQEYYLDDKEYSYKDYIVEIDKIKRFGSFV